MSARYKVTFDFHDDSRNANSQDFRDLLMEKLEQAVLEGRMTNVRVDLDYTAMNGRKYHSSWCDRNNGGPECNCEFSDPPPPIEEQIAQLKAAGWVKLRGRLWKAPVGGYFPGPHGAWLALKSREEASA